MPFVVVGEREARRSYWTLRDATCLPLGTGDAFKQPDGQKQPVRSRWVRIPINPTKPIGGMAALFFLSKLRLRRFSTRGEAGGAILRRALRAPGLEDPEAKGAPDGRKHRGSARSGSSSAFARGPGGFKRQERSPYGSASSLSQGGSQLGGGGGHCTLGSLRAPGRASSLASGFHLDVGGGLARRSF